MIHLVVCYDVVEDRRRAQLHDSLLAYLEPVQKSIFEGAIPEHRLASLRDVIAEAIDPSTDSVRIYHLCTRCRPLVELIGVGPSGNRDLDIIV